MIRKNYYQTEIIQSHDPSKVTIKLNSVLEGRANDDAEITQEGYHPKIGHYAKVRWRQNVVIPENASDRLELKGVTIYCGECPFFQLQSDRRIKYSVCNNGQKTYYDRRACDELCEMVEKGEVVIDS